MYVDVYSDYIQVYNTQIYYVYSVFVDYKFKEKIKNNKKCFIFTGGFFRNMMAFCRLFIVIFSL